MTSSPRARRAPRPLRTVRGRWLAILAVVVLPLVALPTAARADENALILPGGGASVHLGPNSVLRADGRLQYVTECPPGGVGDFFYPATDVYLVEDDPSAGSAIDVPLDDATGTPTTIVQGASMFVEQILAITGPTGRLGPGTYSIVFDTCQDGSYQRRYGDTVFPDAVTVTYPAVIPPEDAAIAALKTAARTDWGRWQDIGRLFDSLIGVEDIASCATGEWSKCVGLIQIWADSPAVSDWIDAMQLAKSRAECLAGDVQSAAGACFGLVAAKVSGSFGGGIRDRVLGGAKSLIANQAKAAYGLYADPPRDDFTAPTSAVLEYPVDWTQGAGGYVDAVSAFAGALERDVALSEALVAAVERYQGARAAGDADAAAARARDAAGIARTLAVARESTARLTAAVFDTVRDEIPTLDALTEQLLADGRRTGERGFSPTEERYLRNQGNAGFDRAEWMRESAAAMTGVFSTLSNLAPVDALVADVDAAGARLTAAADDLDALAAGAADVPTLTIPGRTDAVVGTAASLVATATPGAVVTWDLDADGEFDDGSGAEATGTWVVGGHRVVAARAVTDHGTVTAHGLVDVTSANAAPVVDDAAPRDSGGRPFAAATTGVATTFSVSAHDPEGAALSYEWRIDGVAVAGAADSLTWTPTAADRGEHTVSVTIGDPNPGNVAQFAWIATVADPDADGDGWAANTVADCDDDDPAVRPGRVEVVGNGVDDDCDPATADEPVDLGDGGEVWTWGQGIASQRGDTPAPGRLDAAGDDVVAIAHGDRAGYALAEDGTLQGWGGDDAYVAGIGAVRHPSPVFRVGAPEGAIAGVRAVTDAEPSAYALLGDGRVASWFYGGAGWSGPALGAGIDLHSRAYPDLVLGPDVTGDGTPDPLAGIEEVWQLGGAGLARAGDGTLYQWGARQCSQEGWGYRPTALTAVPEPALTAALAGMRQAVGSSNNPGSAMFRLDDGSVLACGAEREYPWMYTDNVLRPFGDFGPANPAVDVATNGNEWWVVTADGSVWVKTWDGLLGSLEGCTPASCPPGVLHRLPLPADWWVVDVEAGGDIQFRLADGRLVTFSSENTFQSVGHPTATNPVPAEVPAVVEIDGFVLQSETLVWNGFARVVPQAELDAVGWTPPRPGVVVSAVGATGAEGASATAGVTLAAATDVPITVRWRFGAQTGSATVAAGETYAPVTLALPEPDGVWGADRTEILRLEHADANATLGDENAVVTITDVDVPPVVSIDAATLDEGSGDPTAGAATLRLSHPAARPITVAVTAPGVGAAGGDIHPLQVDVTFAPGEETTTVPVAVRGNTRSQPDRTVVLHAESRTPGVASAEGVLTIHDDDPAVVTAASVRVRPGETASIDIAVDGLPAGEHLALEVATAAVSAVPDVDYRDVRSSLDLVGDGDGHARATVAVPTLDADAAEASPALLALVAAAPEPRVVRVTVSIAAAQRTVLGPAPGVVTIVALGAAVGDPAPPTGPGDPAPPRDEERAGTELDGVLGATGGAAPWLALVAAVILLILGAGVLKRARRRSG